MEQGYFSFSNTKSNGDKIMDKFSQAGKDMLGMLDEVKEETTDKMQWIADTFRQAAEADQGKATKAPVAKKMRDYEDDNQVQADPIRAARQTLQNKVSSLLSKSGAVKTVVGKYGKAIDVNSDGGEDKVQTTTPLTKKFNGKLDSAPQWLTKNVVGKPVDTSKLDPKSLPPILARELAKWEKLTHSGKTQLEKKFKSRNLAHPTRYIPKKQNVDENIEVNIEKVGSLWEATIYKDKKPVFQRYAVTESAANNMINNHVEEFLYQEIQSSTDEILNYAKQYVSDKI